MVTFNRATPPYYSVLLYILDIATPTIPLVAKMFYAYKIAPPDLIATTAAVAAAFLWTIGRGAGSFVGGQLTEILELTEVFFCTAIFGVVMCCFVMLVKVTLGRKWEKKVLEEKEVVLQQMNSLNSGGTEAGNDTQDEKDKDIQTTKL